MVTTECGTCRVRVSSTQEHKSAVHGFAPACIWAGLCRQIIQHMWSYRSTQTFTWMKQKISYSAALIAEQQSCLWGLRGLDKEEQVTVADPTVRATACLESIKSGGPPRACQRSRRLDAGARRPERCQGRPYL